MRLPSYFVCIAGLIIIFVAKPVNAQQYSESLSVEFGSVIKAGQKVPFWLWANKRGKVDGSANSAFLDFNYTAPEKKLGLFTFNSGADLTLNVGGVGSVNLSQAYVSTTFKGFKLNVGRYYRQVGLSDGKVGLGSMLIGRNASAMPGIEFTTDDFIAVPFTFGYFKYRIDFGHFWFERDRYIKNAYLHTKDFFLRLDLGRLKLTAGLIHNVMWGGTNPDGVSLGSSLNDYWRVITGKGAPAGHLSQGEVLTALGNVVGGYDNGIMWVTDKILIKATHLFYLEDKSALLFRSAWDGQWALDIEFFKSEPIKHLRYDFLYTIRQDAFANQPGGRANYYGHSVYKSGWTYEDKVLGVPLITFDFNDNGINKTTNNMIVGHSFVAKTKLSKNLMVTTSLVYSRNYGVCNDLRSPNGEGCRGSIEKDIPLDVVQRHTVRKDFYLTGAEFVYDVEKIEGFQIKFGAGLDIMQKKDTNFALTAGIKYYPKK